MAEPKIGFWKSIGIVFLLIGVLWLVQLLQYFNVYDFGTFANHPRHADGIKGIFLSPFVHDKYQFDHIISNTLPCMVLLLVMINAYPSAALLSLAFIHVGTGALVWLLGPADTYHIGISGIIYGMATFLVASGIFRKDRTSVTIAFLIVLIYGGMVAGLFPQKGVSTVSHIFGAVTGVMAAFIFRKIDLPAPHEFDLEPREEEKHFFDEQPGPGDNAG